LRQSIFITLILICSVIAIHTFGQQQPENGGFEYWEEIGFGPDTLEPVNWSSLKTSDGGDLINNVIPVVWERSTDANTGMYSVKLINMPILTLVAPGTLTNGRVHAAVPPTDAYVYTIEEDPQWNTPFTDTPDSLVVWAKYFPVLNDIAHTIAILHTDTAKIADSAMTNWVAIANIDFTGLSDDWTRFSAPFTYLNSNTPEYILFASYAGDAQASLIGSILYLDDFELIYNNVGVERMEASSPVVTFSGDNIIVRWNSKNDNLLTMLEITDLNGRMVFSKNFNPKITSTFTVSLPDGIYICRISNSKMDVVRKLLIK
jgi:hypothetical protein